MNTARAFFGFHWLALLFHSGLSTLAVLQLSAAAELTPLDEWKWIYPNPQGNDLSGAAFGMGQYVVVGKRGTILTSSDGLHWKSSHHPELGNLTDVHYANGRFVAIGIRPTILTSSDGAQWENITPSSLLPEGSEPLREISHGNGIWVIAGDLRYYTSPDGLTWKKTEAGGYVSDLTFSEGRFLSLEPSFGNLQLTLSTNGENWLHTSITNWNKARLDAYNGRIAFVSDTHNRIKGGGGPIGSLFSIDGIHWTLGTPVEGVEFRDVAVGPNSVVAVGHLMSDGGDEERARFLYSKDGTHWTTNSVAPGNNVSFVEWVSDRFLAMGDDGNLWSSMDGESWVSITMGSDMDFTALAEGNGKIVVVGYDDKIWISNRGEDFQPIPSQVEALIKIAFGTGVFVALQESGALFCSRDAIQWQEVFNGQSVGFTNRLTEVRYAGDLFVAIGSGAGIVTSPNGTNWSKVADLPLGSVASHTYGASRHVVTLGFDTILTSNDGRIWQTTSNAYTGSISSLAYGNGIFLALCSATVHQPGQPRFASAMSTNGWDWMGLTNGLFSDDTLAFGHGRFVKRTSGNILSSSVDGQFWSEHTTPNSSAIKSMLFTEANTLLVVGSNRNILESSPLVPTLSAIREDDTHISLEIRGWPGQQCSLQKSSNLLSGPWIPLKALQLETTQIRLSQPATGESGYYRLIQE